DRAAEGWITRPTSTHEVQRGRNGMVRISPPWDVDRIRRVLAVGITAVIIAMAIAGTQTDPIAFLAGLGDAPRTLAMFLPPSDGAMGIRLLEALLVTVQIGLAATLIGVVLAVPIGALAARNVAPNRTCAMVFRTIIVAVR